MNFPKKIQLKHLCVVILVCIVAFSSVGYILGSNGSGGTFTLSSGIYPGAPSYTIWVEDAVYYAKNAYGAIEYSGTNATAVIYNSLSSADGDGFVYVTGGVYLLPSTLIIDKNGSKLIGSGSGRDQRFFVYTPEPLERLTIGTVLKVTASDIDAIAIDGFVSGVKIAHLGIDFTATSTGHGIHGICGGDIGMNEYHIEDIFINNHDADSYAIYLENAVSGRVEGITSFGGCLLSLQAISTSAKYGYDFNSGNTIYQEITGWITKNITNHAVNMNTTLPALSAGRIVNLFIFNRLFIITNRIDLYDCGVHALYMRYVHHTQFNLLNIEVTLDGLGDVVHLAGCHDITFNQPYLAYAGNPVAGWAVHDSTNVRVFGGMLDCTVGDGARENLYNGVAITNVSDANEGSLINCEIYNGTIWQPTNAYGSVQGTSPLTVTHGMANSPSWVSVTPNATAGDWYVGVVDGSDTFTITWTGGGTVWWWWTAGTYQIRP